MGKSKFTVGDVIMLEDLDTGRTYRYTIQSREEKRAVLIDSAGKTKRASILQVRNPIGECLDAEGFNAVFSHDIEDAQDERPLDINKDIDKLRELIEQGATLGKLRDRFRVGWYRLKKAIKENGLSLPETRGVQKLSERSHKAQKLERNAKRIGEMLDEGVPLAQIARHFDVSPYLIRCFMKRHHDIQRPSDREIIRDNLGEVRRMVKAGAFIGEIAKRFGVKDTAVSFVLHEYGISMKHNAGRNTKTRVRCIDRKD